MYVSEFIKLVRDDVGDAVSPYRWSDSAVLAKINAARRFLYGKRPAAFCLSEIIVAEPADITDDRDQLDVLGSYTMALQSYTDYLILREDVDDAASQTLAVNFFESFKQQV